MTIPLSPARTARLFADLDAQQRDLLDEIATAGTALDETPSVPLPRCPACWRRPRQIVIEGDTTRVDFDRCGHVFTLTRAALLVGLAAQRTA
ncbi:hypothetical protein [Streptomyces sp. NPDC087859]|uniref:hypothetical protein n=1 Tax=Streptomyces sp. NPDC087859 TaxID=3365812 RepID=UPI0038043E5F